MARSSTSYKPGQRGIGRSKGAKNKRTLFLEQLGYTEKEIMSKLREKFDEGDKESMQFVFERVAPPRTMENIIPKHLDLSGSPKEQIEKINKLIQEGVLTIGESNKLISNAESHARIIESEKIEEYVKRLKEVEKKVGVEQQ